MELKFWQTCIEITQIPNMENKNLKEVSWLSDPFGNGRVYGVKFSIRKTNFSWKFFLKQKSEMEALVKGYRFLTYLKEIFPGLDGIVRAKPISSAHLNKIGRDYKFLEYFLPEPPYFKNAIPLIQKIVNLMEENIKHNVTVYILWQSVNPIVKHIGGIEGRRKFKYDINYKIKIYIKAKPVYDSNLKRDKQLWEFSGKLESLTSEIKNLDGNCAHVKKAPFSTRQNILEMTPAFDNTIKLFSGISDEDKGDFSPEARVIDFSIPANMNIDIAVPVYNYRYSRIPNRDDPRILLGYAYNKEGVLTKNEASLNLSDLTRHMFISGKTGAGKSMFEAFLFNEIQTKGKNVGTMVINLRKEREEDLFKSDIILKKGDPNFQVPYFVKGDNVDIVCEQVASYMVASLGLKNVVVTIMNNVLYEECSNNGYPPEDPKECFQKVLEWLEKRPYPRKYQLGIIRAIQNRVIKLLSSPYLRNVIKLGPIPHWFIEWTKGKSIFVDLSEFNDSEKRLLTLAIFQMINTLITEDRSNKLKYAIFLDEVNEILRKPSYQEYGDDETIKQHILEKVFNKILSSLRSRGVGLLLADQMPMSLFEDVYKQPSLKVIFRSEKEYIQIITNNPDEQDDLINQEDRRALFLDGVNGRKFAIYTMGFSYYRNSLLKGEKFCLNCNNIVPNNLKFCNTCGTIISSKNKEYKALVN